VTARAPEGGSEGEMSTFEELQRDCAYCRQPITLKWKNGLVLSESVRLVVDQVFHDKCWDKFFAVYNGKRTLPRGAEGQRRPGLDAA
jgi:hypothetical protein